MKNVKPLLGAMSIVGKDINGRKIILPTDPEGLDKMLMTRGENKKTSRINKFLSVVKRRLTSIKVNPLKDRFKMVTMKKRDYDNICNSYTYKVDERLSTAKELWKKNRRAEMGLNY